MIQKQATNLQQTVRLVAQLAAFFPLLPHFLSDIPVYLSKSIVSNQQNLFINQS